jgi:phage gpG-like protein
MITARLVGTEKLEANLGKMFTAWADRIEIAIKKFTIELQTIVKTQKLVGGNPLHQRSGNLVNSIKQDVERDEKSVRGYVYSEGGKTGKPNLPYASVHEWGGTFFIPAHMSGKKSGQNWFVRGHMATYPERSYLRSTLRENKERFRQVILAAVKGVSA